MAVPQYEGGEKNNKVVNRKEIDYTLLWPIALAPVIPAVGIALRYVFFSLLLRTAVCFFFSKETVRRTSLTLCVYHQPALSEAGRTPNIGGPSSEPSAR